MENLIDETHVDKTVSKKKYSLDFKLSTIIAAEKEGNRPVATRLNISESRVRKSFFNVHKYSCVVCRRGEI